MNRTIHAADLFCGAGGTSTGCLMACAELGLEVQLLAINHWNIAIDTHMANHPGVQHICGNVGALDPRLVVPGGRLDLLLASPECTDHSNARGGKPMSDQKRAMAWDVLRWIDALRVDHVIVENVREFRDWGPLDDQGKRIKPLKGTIYRAFLDALAALGYTVEDRILNAADYGDATTRKRLFIQARRGFDRTIRWPAASHLRPKDMEMIEGAERWRAAREVIDWTIKGQSIYGRKRPLAPNTMRRIYAGLAKYSGLPFIVPQFGERDGQGPRCHGVDAPMPTVTSHGAGAVVEPFLVVLRNHQDGKPIDGPIPTLCANGEHVGVCEPFLVKYFEGSDACPVDAPLPAITASYEHLALCEPFLVNYKGQSNARGIDEPTPTITAHAPNLYLAEPFFVRYNNNGGPRSVDEPVPTITTRDRVGLVEPEVHQDGDTVAMLDIRFRMLQPHELAAAMSFPAGYVFAGNRSDKVRQIGNAVPVRLAQALCGCALGQMGV